MKTNHTPGPWTTEKQYGTNSYDLYGGGSRADESSIWIGSIHADHAADDGIPTEGFPSNAECVVNARLIATAPELLAVLQRIADCAGPFNDSHSEYWTINEGDVSAARAAIKKARG